MPTAPMLLCAPCHRDAAVRFEEDEIDEIGEVAVAAVYLDTLDLCVLHAAQFDKWQTYMAGGATYMPPTTT